MTKRRGDVEVTEEITQAETLWPFAPLGWGLHHWNGACAIGLYGAPLEARTTSRPAPLVVSRMLCDAPLEWGLRHWAVRCAIGGKDYVMPCAIGRVQNVM